MGIDAGLAGWGFIPGGLTFGDDVGRDGSDIGWSDAGWCGVLHSGGVMPVRLDGGLSLVV